MAHEDHPFVKNVRKVLDIGEDENFFAAIVPKFICVEPNDRKRDLARFDEAIGMTTDLRQETQLANTARRLRDVDAKLRRTGR